MKLRKLYTNKYTSIIGDCDDCGHSVIYHLPLAGCIKCGCDEFH